MATTVKSSWATWHPRSRQDREDVIEELEQVLASPQFCNSKRYPALLRYVVEASLAGNADLLKERTLGIEVFHRPPSYDTNSDTIVRYTAGEVRKRLSLYYHEHQYEAAHRVQISLPPGSYMPEFLALVEEPAEVEAEADGAQADLPELTAAASAQPALPATQAGPHTGIATFEPLVEHPFESVEVNRQPAAETARSRRQLTRRAALAAMLGAAAGAGALAARLWPVPSRGAVEEFWAPVLEQNRHATRLGLGHAAGSTLICSGSVVFAPGNFSGTTTAGRDIDYPFVSMQLAMAIARISGRLERMGGEVEMQASATTPLNTLRERSVVLIGGFNNDWTMRLIAPLRFRMSIHPHHSIVDRDHPETMWSRDSAQGYASADDYALIARYHDATTNSLIVVVAGIGRNGTEAAADFVTSPTYMEMLKSRIGSDLRDKNLEAVLKISVIDGKTGAPSIQAVAVW